MLPLAINIAILDKHTRCLKANPSAASEAVHPKLARTNRKEVAGGKGRTYYHPLLDTSSATKEQKNMLDIVCERIMY